MNNLLGSVRFCEKPDLGTFLDLPLSAAFQGECAAYEEQLKEQGHNCGLLKNAMTKLCIRK